MHNIRHLSGLKSNAEIPTSGCYEAAATATGDAQVKDFLLSSIVGNSHYQIQAFTEVTNII